MKLRMKNNFWCLIEKRAMSFVILLTTTVVLFVLCLFSISNYYSQYQQEISLIRSDASDLCHIEKNHHESSSSSYVSFIYYVPDESSLKRWKNYHCWFRELLHNATCKIRFILDPCRGKDGKQSSSNCKFQSNSVVWFNAHSTDPRIKTLDIINMTKHNNKNKNQIILVHNNDETGKDNQFHKHYSRVKHVFRAYYQPYQSLNSTVHWIPLGPGPRRWSSSIRNDESLHICVFYGELHNRGDRNILLQQTTEWCTISSSITNYSDYEQILQRSVFGLAPAGNNDETYRFWEYLEYGIVPIVLNRYNFVQKLKTLYHDNLPFIMVDSWLNVSTQLQLYRNVNNTGWNWTSIKLLQHNVSTWYRAFKKSISTLFSQSICSIGV